MRPYYVLLFVLMGAVTYATRIGFLGVARQVELHPMLRRALEYVPVSILATLVFPVILAPDKTLALSPSNPYLWAAAVTAAVMLLLKRQWLAVVLGMVALVAARAVLGT